MNLTYQIKTYLDNFNLSDNWIQEDTVTINFLLIKQRIFISINKHGIQI